MWALGAILYELCEFKKVSDSQISKSYSDDLQNLVSRCLHEDPNQRPFVSTIIEMPFIKTLIQMSVRYSESLLETGKVRVT